MFDRPLRVYISGPMTGLPDLNRAAFAAAATWCREQGFEPVNPHEVDPSHPWSCPAGQEALPAQVNTTGTHTHPYACWLRADITAQLTCDMILMLPGWPWSKGSRIEHQLAESVGQPVLDYTPATIALTGATR
jgi:hypothetical protein